VYAYFNNDWFGHAVTDAVALRDDLHRRLPALARHAEQRAAG
jgi:hypothetical protein